MQRGLIELDALSFQSSSFEEVILEIEKGHKEDSTGTVSVDCESVDFYVSSLKFIILTITAPAVVREMGVVIIVRIGILKVVQNENC